MTLQKRKKDALFSAMGSILSLWERIPRPGGGKATISGGKGEFFLGALEGRKRKKNTRVDEKRGKVKNLTERKREWQLPRDKKGDFGGKVPRERKARPIP